LLHFAALTLFPRHSSQQHLPFFPTESLWWTIHSDVTSPFNPFVITFFVVAFFVVAFFVVAFFLIAVFLFFVIDFALS
jgi:hypothetical protein